MSIALYLLSFAFLSPTVPAEERGGTLAWGTRFETPWVQIDGAAPGPTVFIVGGVHGNEPAGYVAAEAITHWSIARGRLVVVPRACAPAIAANERTIPGLPEKEGNLNRYFPSEGPPRAGIAAELWALAVIDAKVIDREHWRRGRGDVPIESTRRGREWLGAPKDPFELRYINGPILAPAERPEIPDYATLLVFRGEVADNGAPSGVMPGTPAAVVGVYGEGQAMAVSPHPERTPGRGVMLRRAVSWLVDGVEQREPAGVGR